MAADDNHKLPDLILVDSSSSRIDPAVPLDNKLVKAAIDAVQSLNIPDGRLSVTKTQENTYRITNGRTTYPHSEGESEIVLNAETPQEIELQHRSSHQVYATIEIDPKSNQVDFIANHDGSFADTIIDRAAADITAKISGDHLTQRVGGGMDGGQGLDGVSSMQGAWTRAAAQTLENNFTKNLGIDSPERIAGAATEVGAPPIQAKAVPMSQLNLVPGIYQ